MFFFRHVADAGIRKEVSQETKQVSKVQTVYVKRAGLCRKEFWCVYTLLDAVELLQSAHGRS